MSLLGESQYGLSPSGQSPVPSLALPLWSYLPYDSYDPETGLFHNVSSSGFVLEATPIAGASLSDQDKLDKFFTKEGHLPEGCSVQFLLYGSPRIDSRLQYWQRYRLDANTNQRYKDLAKRRYAYLQQKAFDKEHPVRDFKVLISYTMPDLVLSSLETEDLLRTRESLIRSFEKIGLYAKPMTDQRLIQEVRNILNYEQTTTDDAFWYSPHESIAKQIVSRDLDARVEKDGVYLRNKAYVAHSYLPKKSPKKWALGHMDKLFGGVLNRGETIPCAFLLHYGFTVCRDQNLQKKKAASKREALEVTLKNPLSKWQPNIQDEFQEAREVVDAVQQGERIIDACLSLTTFCETSELESVKSTVESLWTDHMWAAESATYNHLNILLSSLPMTWTKGSKRTVSMTGVHKSSFGLGADLSELGVARKTITREPQNLLPIVGEWTGQLAPGVPLTGPNGQLTFWNPWDGMFIPGQELNKPTGNYNFSVSGVAGSGKSFLCNEIIKNTCAVGGKAFVMDKGGSFKNLCMTLGGKHINFDFQTQFSLNPFTYIPEGNSPDDLKDRNSLFTGLVSIVTQMAFPSGSYSDAEHAFLKEAIYQVWNTKASRGSIDDIASYLSSVDDIRAQDIARSIVDFTSKGSFGGFFNPPATIDIASDLVVVETDNLEEPLKSVMVMMMMVQVWQRMIGSDRKAPYLILIDEAWDLLRGKATGDFIEALSLTARKYRCAMGTATQSLSHYFKDGLTGPQASWENSAWKVVLKQEDDTLSGLKDHPQLSEFVNGLYRETLLRSLKSAKTYSEMVLFHAEVPGVPARLYCDPYTTVLYSTNAHEVAMLNDYQAAGHSLDESIEAVLAHRQSR